MNWLEQITKLTKIRARYFFAAWVFGALLIFLPALTKEQMGVAIPEAVRPWVGFSALAAFVLWLVLATLQITDVVQGKLKMRRLKAEALRQLETLTQGERDFFLQCLLLNQRTLNRNINDSAVNSLLSKRLLVMATNGSVLAMPHTIPQFVWDHIKTNEADLFPELSDTAAMKELDLRHQDGWMRL